MWFPIQTQTAAVKNGFYEIDFAQITQQRLLQWISLIGPAGSSVNVYLETIFIDTTPRGDFNRADYFAGIPIAGGQTLRLVWSVGAGTPVPTASIGCTDGGSALEGALTGNSQIIGLGR